MSQNGLSGQRALIVGGGSGIGQACAWALAAGGCRCAVAGRTTAKLAETCGKNFPEGEILAHEVDVTSRASLEKLILWFEAELGPIDILVNAAGVNIVNRSMGVMTPEDWDRVLAINATGSYNCLAAVLPAMRERQQGLVIQISSVAGKRALELGGVAYCASKFAMTALGTAAGQEEAPNGIRITNVYPGEVDTPLLEQRPTPVTEEHRARILQPTDVAEMVVAIAALPPRAHVPELVIKPRLQQYC